MFLRICSILLLAISLTACKKEAPEEGVGRYGMLDDNTPQYAAVRFMQSIYEENSIDVAISLSTERMARVLQRYHTNRNVQRHVLNLMFDEVEVSPEGSGGVGRMEFAKKATLVLFFSGYYHDDKIDDLRTIEMVRVDGDWKVDRIKPDRFL